MSCSPCLFKMVISDLDTMLIHQSGVVIGNARIKGPHYADDIVLFVENEHSLQAMLNIVDTFAKNWGLSFNSKISQVQNLKI